MNGDLNVPLQLERLVAYRADGSVSPVVVAGRLSPDVCARQMRAAYDAVMLGRTPELPTLQDAKLWHVRLTRADL